jgi:hypothetical protein
MTNWTPKFTGTHAAASLALTAWCAPAFAQEASSLPTPFQQAARGAREAQPDNSPPAELPSSDLQHLCEAIQVQDSPNPPEEEAPERQRPISYGVEIALSSGHADRGIVISDRPVFQPVTWVSGKGVSFSVWGSLTLGETTDGSRPQILEMELTREHEGRHLTVEPAVRMFFYRDPLSIDSSRSIEGWLNVSYSVGPLRLFTNHSVDVLAHRGAYFGEAGLALERRDSQRIKVGGSWSIAWASSRFNHAYVGIDKSALNRLSVEGWLTAYVKPRLYIGPSFKFSTTVDRAVRAELARPSYFFVGLTTGVEF